MPVYRTEAIVLKRVDFGEADRILTLYTKHRGKIKAIAKGVRRPTSRKGGNVELFNRCKLALAEGRNFDIITEAESVDSFAAIRDDLEKTGWAYCAVELVDRLTPEGQVSRKVFDLLAGVLADLNPRNLRRFAEELLKNLGFWKEELAEVKSLQGYIESIVERKLNGPEFVAECNSALRRASSTAAQTKVR